MKLLLKAVGYIIILALAIYWSKGNLKLAFQVSVSVIGSIAFIYATIGMYENLKSVRFHFRYISKDLWIRLGIIYLLVWGAFILTLPCGILLWECITLPMILIILFIYDRITSFFRN